MAIPFDMLPKWVKVITAYDWLLKQQKHSTVMP